MPKADTSVKWFHSGMANSPVCRGESGALVELLDACLVNGFSTRTPDSIVVADGVATVTIGAGNPYEKHAVIKIASASDAELNADWRLATSGASSFTFSCPGVADGTITGASIIRAPAGWVKPFADTNIGVYQSADTASTQLYLRVNDANARYTRVRGYENMTDASTGTGLFPTIAQRAETAMTWPKSNEASSAARAWTLIADGSFVWLLVYASSNELHAKLMHHFGDINSFVPGDQYHCTLCAVGGASDVGGAGHQGAGSSNSSSVPRTYARGVSQTGTAVTSFITFFCSSGTLWSGGPSAPGFDGNIRVGGPVFASADGVNSHVRGIMPGAVSSVESPSFSDNEIVEAGGRVFLAARCNTEFNTTGVGVALFDVVGPWR